MSVSDGVVAHLASLRSLRDLWIFGLKDKTAFTGKTLDQLAKLPNLSKVKFSYSGFNDEGLAALGRVPTVKNLDLSETQVSDAGVGHLLKLKSLQDLNVAKISMTPAGLAKLQEVKTLNALGYFHSGLPEFASDVRKIAGILPQIETIQIRGNLTGEQIRELGAFRALKSVRLGCGPVGEAILPPSPR